MTYPMAYSQALPRFLQPQIFLSQGPNIKDSTLEGWGYKGKHDIINSLLKSLPFNRERRNMKHLSCN